MYTMKKKSNRPIWKIPLNLVTKTGKRVYEGLQGAVFILSKGGNRSKVPSSGLKYKPMKTNNIKNLFKPKY